MKMLHKLTTATVVAATSFVAFAGWLSDDSIEQAASVWLSSDKVAQLTMKGLTFGKLTHRGSLRIVHLVPGGYIIMSGSDASDPVVAFSRNGFAEPSEGSAFHAMLDSSGANVAKREEEKGGRTAKWEKLIGRRDGSKSAAMRLSAGGTVEPSTILIEQFMAMHWNQWQPYNDFTPVYDENADDNLYRARCPCGCVATATAQQMAHCQWPWRTGRTDTWVHSLDADGEVESNGIYAESEFTVRADGRLPFDWDAMLDNYSWWWGDARGHVAESDRFHLARFISWVDAILQMNFSRNGSGSNFWIARDSTSDWYEPFESCDLESRNDYGVAKIKADLELGFPVHVGVPGHSVVAHGYASDGESDWLYINYGFGGSEDGWYKLYDSPIGCAFPGFRPRKMVQLEPLPKVSGRNLEVKWHLPDCHTNSVTGFEITKLVFGNQTGDLVYDFSADCGTASDPGNIYMTKLDGIGNDTVLLWWDPVISGTYDFDDVVLLTSSSVLSYAIQSAYFGSGRVEILASFDGGDWQVVSEPLLYWDSDSQGWITNRVFLGNHGGQTVRLRIRVSRHGGWYGYRSLLLDDFVLTDVIRPEEQSVFADASARSHVFKGLTGGSLVSVSVKPLFGTEDGEISKPETVRIEGTAAKPLPKAISEYVVADSCYGSAKAGKDWALNGTAEGDTAIKARNAWTGGFSVRLYGTVDSRSKLSFSWYATGYYAEEDTFDEFTATFIDDNGFASCDFWVCTNSTQAIGKQRVELPLSQFEGKSGVVQFVFRHNGANYAGDGDTMRFYEPELTNIRTPVIPGISWGEETWETAPSPEILSVKGSDGLEIDEGLYREIGIGEDTLRVSCSASAETLRAYPSHLSLVDDGDVAVEKIAAGEFLVKMDTSKAPRRSRMILTLEATDRNGTTAYRNLSLRFDDSASVRKLDRMRKLDTLADAKPIDAFQFENSMENSGPGELVGSIWGGGVSYVESPLGQALHHDGLDGPYNGGNLDFPDEWTILTIAKTSGTDNAVLFEFGSSGSGQYGFALASGGKNTVTLSHWKPDALHKDAITVNVPRASGQYHAYALRGNGLNVEMFVDGIFAGSTTLPAVPRVGFQFFSVISGDGNTGLTNASGECVDDWRMFATALPDTAIVAYANMLLMFDENKAGEKVGDVVVPECWFKKYYPGDSLSQTALTAKAANGRSIWECYVAGLDPTAKDDDLVAGIAFENGVPKVSIANGEKANRSYRILAVKALDCPETPLDVTDVPDLSAEPYGEYRFFRISAEIP